MIKEAYQQGFNYALEKLGFGQTAGAAARKAFTGRFTKSHSNSSGLNPKVGTKMTSINRVTAKPGNLAGTPQPVSGGPLI